MQTEMVDSRRPVAFRSHDPRLEPIAAKVLARERLDFNDGLALYGSPDVLAVGWLANHVRERLHGDVTYFNVNRHINPTNVCVAACKLCAFGRKKGDPAGYTMALEEAWETAASGYSEAVTEFHIVGGLHPDLPLEYFLDLVRGLKERFPQVHIKAFTMVEVAYLARRARLTIEQALIKLREAGVDSMPGGGAEIFAARVRSIICDHKIDGEEWLDGAAGPQAGLEVECNHALRPHRERRGPRGPPAEVARSTGRDRRLPDLHSAGLSPGKHAARPFAGDHGTDGYSPDCGEPPAAGQFSAHQGLLADDDGEDCADCAALWRR